MQQFAIMVMRARLPRGSSKDQLGFFSIGYLACKVSKPSHPGLWFPSQGAGTPLDASATGLQSALFHAPVLPVRPETMKAARSVALLQDQVQAQLPFCCVALAHSSAAPHWSQELHLWVAVEGRRDKLQPLPMTALGPSSLPSCASAPLSLRSSPVSGARACIPHALIG
eukprot:1157948-Pelagomonas_calceolata.AAC.1